MSQNFPKYRKSKRWPYNPPQDPKFYKRFDVALKLTLSAIAIVVTYLMIRPDLTEWVSYRWWLLAIVCCIGIFMLISHYLPPFLYGYVMINKKYWKIDHELDEMQQCIDRITEEGMLPYDSIEVEATTKTEPKGKDEAEKIEDSNPGSIKVDEEVFTVKEDTEAAKSAERDIDYEAMNRSNHRKNINLRLDAFMATVEIARKAMEERRKQEEAEKLAKILNYTLNTFIEFDFTDEELFQLSECIRLFCTEKSVLSSPNINIYKKDKLKQADIKNFVWNIGNVYEYPVPLMAEFVCATFSAWFKNTERSTVERNMKTTKGVLNIEIDQDLMKHI